MRKLAYFLLLSLIVLACERNRKPVISDLTCSPESRSAGTIFTLKVLASDEDGDLLTYLWKADDGNFTTSTNTREVKWKSPVSGAGKTFSITVVVSDGTKEVTRTFQILLGEPELGSVSGQVNFTNFKIPIPDVTLSIGGKTATSDLNGQFFLSGIPAIDDTLFAGKQDFSSVKSVVKIPANDTISVTIELTSVNFTTKVSGTVKDQEGLLVDNVKVAALNPDGSASKLKTTTDESGFYRLWYIPFGERTIVASKEATSDASYSTLTTTVDCNDLQTQLNLVLQKTNFSGKFTDLRDQHVYNFKKIGSQFWMIENLAYLPEVSPPTVLSSKESNYYIYGYSGTDTLAAIATDNYKTYGVLYNWTALKTACPPGWHAPSHTEWINLDNYLGDVAGLKMKSVSGWNQHGGGSNASGFNAFPAGQVNIDGAFSGLGDGAYLWTSTVLAYLQPGFRGLQYDSNELLLNRGSEKMGCSIRCIRNN
ncbi:MAG: hypothetical protein D4R64_05665 [Porphyromonadaceae bacterium]|nr:MAG: hypothetical protein D4R64_05665 [Porphyromonadaceae bacterium]